MTYNKDWTLFLDRDGVINQRIPGDYIKTVAEFEFLPGSLEAIVQLTPLFNRICVVTNQQGIAKGRMTEDQLHEVHDHMLKQVTEAGGHIDKVYYCRELSIHNPPCRKPNTGMGLQAQKDFPNINFEQAIIVGDSISDMVFGHRLGMKTVFITTKTEEQEQAKDLVVDYRLDRLFDFLAVLEQS